MPEPNRTEVRSSDRAARTRPGRWLAGVTAADDLILAPDDAIVVVMELRSEQCAEKIQAIAARLRRENAESRKQREEWARRDVERAAARLAGSFESSGTSMAWERPLSPDDPFARLEQRFETLGVELRGSLAEVRLDVLKVRDTLEHVEDRVATKVELEALRDDYNIIADGFASVSTELTAVNGRLDGLDARLGRLERRLTALEQQRAG